jgi:hypothetical protein
MKKSISISFLPARVNELNVDKDLLNEETQVARFLLILSYN